MIGNPCLRPASLRYGNGCGYRKVYQPEHPRAGKKGYVKEQILVAETVFGQLLPPAAVVHHRNGIRDDNRTANLVICENQAYHNLIHARQRAYEATGDANARRCVICHQYELDPAVDMPYWNRSYKHRACFNRYANEGYHRRKRGFLRSP